MRHRRLAIFSAVLLASLALAACGPEPPATPTEATPLKQVTLAAGSLTYARPDGDVTALPFKNGPYPVFAIEILKSSGKPSPYNWNSLFLSPLDLQGTVFVNQLPVTLDTDVDYAIRVIDSRRYTVGNAICSPINFVIDTITINGIPLPRSGSQLDGSLHCGYPLGYFRFTGGTSVTGPT